MNYFRILQLLKPLVQRGSIKSIDEALDYMSMENLTKLLQGQQLESNQELLLDVPETTYAKNE